jgi:3-hydroxybutyryl-CoA dehydrogenase
MGGVTMGVKRIGVVGSGIMGAGVAEVAARSGFEVVLRSRTQEGADAMLGGLEASLARQVQKGRLEQPAANDIRGRVGAVTALDELAACDLVLESVVEDLAVKQELFGELDRVCAPDAILATNTSTLPVVELAMVTGRPDRVCGVHFFNPAPAMALVELVPAITTSEATLEEARAFVVACGKTAVTVRDQAGFVVNALLFPYLNNAVKLFDAGVASRDDIDVAMKGGCNFPMGPLELLDLVGLDTSLAILDALYAEFRDPNFAPAPLLRRMVAADRLGRKSGSGFYDYRR